MNLELETKLIKKYPKIFRDAKETPDKTAMCWGFECGDGWYWLIDNLCEALQFDIDNNNYPQIVASQVKEKWGELRFYTYGENDKQDAMIDFAMFLSQSICEKCGATGATRNKTGWVITLCDKCRNPVSDEPPIIAKTKVKMKKQIKQKPNFLIQNQEDGNK